MKRLNGWQRVYVIAVAVWFAAYAVKMAKDLPTAEKSRATWAALAEAEAPSMRQDRQAFLDCIGSHVLIPNDNANESAEKCDALAKSGATLEDRKHFADVIAKGEADIRDELPRAQAIEAGLTLASWLITSGLLYGCGMLVAWVARGFRKPA